AAPTVVDRLIGFAPARARAVIGARPVIGAGAVVGTSGDRRAGGKAENPQADRRTPPTAVPTAAVPIAVMPNAGAGLGGRRSRGGDAEAEKQGCQCDGGRLVQQ